MRHFCDENKGFTTLEVVIGLVLMTVVAIAGSIAVIRTTQAIMNQRITKKASALGQMVLEQYKSYSGQNFNILDSYSLSDQPIQTFLNPANDPAGYQDKGRFRITTTATYDPSRTNCLVISSITWTDARGPQEIVFREVFVERSPLHFGKMAKVWVKMPCDTGTDDSLIITTCPGIKNVTVSVPSETNASILITGQTDVNGLAILPNIKVSALDNPDDLVEFKAVSPGSAFTIRQSEPGFVQGYYNRKDPFHIDDSSSVWTVGTEVVVLFKDFRKLGHISGTISPAIGDAYIRLSKPARVFDPSTPSSHLFKTCLSDPADPVMSNFNFDCRVKVKTDGSGQYEFNNIVPIDSFSVAANPGLDGTPYTSHSITSESTDPAFLPGYTGFDWFPIPAWPLLTEPPATDPPAINQPTLSVFKKGSVRFTLAVPIAGLDLKAAFMRKKDAITSLDDVSVPLQASLSPDLLSGFTIHTTPAGKRLYLNNWVIDAGLQGGRDSLPILAVWGESPANPEGYYGRAEWSCTSGSPPNCMGTLGDVTLTMTRGYKLDGPNIKIINGDPENAVAIGEGLPSFIFETPLNFGKDWEKSSLSDGNGKFEMSKFWPDIHPPINIPGILGAIKVVGKVSNSASGGYPADIPVIAREKTNTTYLAGQAPVVLNVVEAGVIVTKTYWTDANGKLDVSANLPSQEKSSYIVNECNSGSGKCKKIYSQYAGAKPTGCDEGSGPDEHLGYCEGVWLWNTKQFYTGGVPSAYFCEGKSHIYGTLEEGTSYTHPCSLEAYRIYGKVTDSATGEGVGNIEVVNPFVAGGVCKTSNSGSDKGNYSCLIKVGPSDHFHATVGLKELTIGHILYTNPQPISPSGTVVDNNVIFTLPNPLTPSTGLEQNWKMDKTLLGSGI